MPAASLLPDLRRSIAEAVAVGEPEQVKELSAAVVRSRRHPAVLRGAECSYDRTFAEADGLLPTLVSYLTVP